MSRLQRDLKKIVGIDEIKRKLAEIQDRAPIESTRGIAYQDGSTGQVRNGSGSGGTGGITAPPGALGSGIAAAAKAATDAAIAAASAGGANGSNFGATTAPVKDSEDGMYDLQDIFDGFADTGIAGGGTGFAPRLSGIDGWKDCATEEEGVVRFDSYITPINWDSPDQPPLDTSWVAGKYWLFFNAFYGSTWGALLSDAASKGFIIRTQDALLYPANRYGTSGNPSPGARLAGYSAANVAVQGDNTPPSYLASYITSGVVGYGPAGTCPMPAGYACQGSQPYDTTWDMDNFQVLFNNNTGLYETNKYDQKAPSTYKTPSSSVFMCFDGGTRTAILENGSGDTKLLYETDPTSGAPKAGTYLHIYDGKGQIKGYADVSLINQYLP